MLTTQQAVCHLAFHHVDGEDYIGGSFPVTLARQVNAQQCISITVLSDFVRERQENFNISIQLPDNLPQVQTGIPATATVFIDGN